LGWLEFDTIHLTKVVPESHLHLNRTVDHLCQSRMLGHGGWKHLSEFKDWTERASGRATTGDL